MTDPNASIEYLDDPAMGGSVPLLDAGQANDVLRDAKRIAIVGASPNPWRASNTVMSYLMSRGYECVPVNPNVGSVLGRPSFPSLEAASAGSGGAPFDIVDVFRRPEFAPDIARSAVTLGAGTLWLQQGVLSWEAAEIAHDGGLGVVMDRCTAIDHRHLSASAR
ncbi:MAG: CoA-binding protein [Chloroflexota bacterium]